MAKVMAIVALAVVTMAMVALPMGASAMSCVQVDFSLLPCLGYVRSAGGVPPPTCCRGISNLLNEAKTVDDRRTACNCLKSLAGQASNDELNRGIALPGKCGVAIPFKISPDINCSLIN